MKKKLLGLLLYVMLVVGLATVPAVTTGCTAGAHIGDMSACLGNACMENIESGYKRVNKDPNGPETSNVIRAAYGMSADYPPCPCALAQGSCPCVPPTPTPTPYLPLPVQP